MTVIFVHAARKPDHFFSSALLFTGERPVWLNAAKRVEGKIWLWWSRKEVEHFMKLWKIKFKLACSFAFLGTFRHVFAAERGW